MHGMALLLVGLLGGVGVVEYSRPLDARKLDQATLDAEGYGEKKSFQREDDGLRITLSPGGEETGWKTPPQLKIGGDFTITANLVIRKLPKPAQEDGAAVGLAIAFQDVNQPDVALVRLKEPSGPDVYRSIERATNNPAQVPASMPFEEPLPPGAKPPKPPRRTFPAAGDAVRLELQREGNTVRYQVLDAKSGRPRYLGQVALGTNDVSALKLFATNRNGAEAVDVLLRDIAIHADRINGLGTVVRTVFDEVVHADPTSIEDGILIVGGQPRTPAAANPKAREEKAAAGPTNAQEQKTGDGPPKAQASAPPQPTAPKEPKARIPLVDVESIRFERAPALAARFLGQSNLDFTMPGPGAKKDAPGPKDEAKKAVGGDDVLAPPPGTTITKMPRVNPEKNGIRDVNLSLSGLRDAKIKQITVQCQTDRGSTGWRLDTTDSKDWPLVFRRSGTEAWADLFLEPPPGDVYQKDFQIAVNYEDGQNANTTVKAAEHTDPNLAVDSKATSSPRFDATVHLTGEEKLCGKVEGIGPESLRLTTPWQDHLDVPLTRIVGVQFGLLDRKESPESFARRFKSRGSEDLLLAQSKDGEVVAIPGALEGTEDDKLRFSYQGRSRTLPLKQVEGLILAARPESRQPDELRPTFSLPGGVVVAGRWKDLDTSVWRIEAAWGQELKLPAAEIQGVRLRGGTMTYLSDLDPSKVEETPFFGRRLSWRRNVGLLGEPLKINGQTYERGLAVHSRCLLTYDLDRRYSTFEALVGFDDASKGNGRVDCRVFADGKELYANPDLRADGPPVKLALPVMGAEQLRLLVDFGRGQDTGDRVIWANARLYRRPPTGASSATSASRRDPSPESGNAAERR